MRWITRLRETITGKCMNGGKPLYKAGDLVRPRRKEFIVSSDDGKRLDFRGKDRCFSFCVYDKWPLIKVRSVERDGYVVQELHHIPTYESFVPFGGFEAATTRDFPRPTMGAVEVVDKSEQPLQTGGIHKWKRSVKVCGENLGEIIRLPFVKSVVPKIALDDEYVGVFEYDGLPKKDTDGRFCINTSLYHIPVGDSGWFVQDACGGWRWLNDEDYEEHKDDVILP